MHSAKIENKYFRWKIEFFLLGNGKRQHGIHGRRVQFVGGNKLSIDRKYLRNEGKFMEASLGFNARRISCSFCPAKVAR